jgi:hypothetical protein
VNLKLFKLLLNIDLWINNSSRPTLWTYCRPMFSNNINAILFLDLNKHITKNPVDHKCNFHNYFRQFSKHISTLACTVFPDDVDVFEDISCNDY